MSGNKNLVGEFRCEDAVQNWDNRRKEVETEIKMHGAKFKCKCFINMQEFRHACRAFEYLHEYLRGNAGKPDCKIFSWIFVASDGGSGRLAEQHARGVVMWNHP